MWVAHKHKLRDLILFSGIAGFVLLFLGFNAEAIENHIITPNSIECSPGYFINSYDSDTGNYECAYSMPSSKGNNTLSSIDTVFSEKLSRFDDETHTYIESRFNGVGENIVPSGSQFQIWCDEVTNQNCTLWMTSADEKTSAVIFSKYIDGQWVKVSGITEGPDHNSMQFLTYDDDDKGILRMKMTDDRTEIQNGLRIMSKNSSTNGASEIMRFYDDNRITLYSGADRCNIKVVDQIVRCE